MKTLSRIRTFLSAHPLAILLVFLPLAMLAEFARWGELWVFSFSAIGVIPMAGYIGEATEARAHYTGSKLGGLLNATLGNAAELIITIFAIRKGLLELVKASITGSILGNLLLVLGMAMLFGGFRHGVQRFDRRQASHNAILLAMTVLMLVVPSLVSHSIHPAEVGLDTDPMVEALSLGIAAVMIVLFTSYWAWRFSFSREARMY